MLHIGCADAPYTRERGEDLLHKRLSKITNNLWGIDLSSEGCEILTEMGFDNIIHGDISDLHSYLKNEEFDIVLAGEVIEHLNNPGLFLQNISKIMASGADLLITTVNSPSIKQIIFAVMRKEKVHPDHNYYFSYYTLKHFIRKEWFNPERCILLSCLCKLG